MAKIPGLRIVAPNDVEEHKILAAKVSHVEDFWPDENKVYQNPGQWYISQFCNPMNLVFDLEDGKGMLAFLYTVPGWRAQVFTAKWDTTQEFAPESRVRALWEAAARVAILTNDLLVIDGFVRTTNEAAQSLAERMGMVRRGLIRGQVHYNGIAEDTYWYEIHRDDLGIPQEGS